MSENTEDKEFFVRTSKAHKVVGVSRATFAEWRKKSSPYFKPSMPRKIEYGGTASGYIRSELIAWMKSNTAN